MTIGDLDFAMLLRRLHDDIDNRCAIEQLSAETEAAFVIRSFAQRFRRLREHECRMVRALSRETPPLQPTVDSIVREVYEHRYRHLADKWAAA